jgi:hypothetical protein
MNTFDAGARWQRFIPAVASSEPTPAFRRSDIRTIYYENFVEVAGEGREGKN